jgi:hypothetical protein
MNGRVSLGHTSVHLVCTHACVRVQYASRLWGSRTASSEGCESPTSRTIHVWIAVRYLLLLKQLALTSFASDLVSLQVPIDSFYPVLHMYWNDDLTVAWWCSFALLTVSDGHFLKNTGHADRAQHLLHPWLVLQTYILWFGYCWLPTLGNALRTGWFVLLDEGSRPMLFFSALWWWTEWYRLWFMNNIVGLW